LLDDEPNADGGREVIDEVALVDQLVDDLPVEDGVDDEMEAFVVAEVLHVGERARREVVEHPHLVAFIEQQLGEVRPDEPGATGD